jgi:hypothetical protein
MVRQPGAQVINAIEIKHSIKELFHLPQRKLADLCFSLHRQWTEAPCEEAQGEIECFCLSAFFFPGGAAAQLRCVRQGAER